MKYLLAGALMAASLSAPENFPWWMAGLVILFGVVFKYYFGREKR